MEMLQDIPTTSSHSGHLPQPFPSPPHSHSAQLHTTPSRHTVLSGGPVVSTKLSKSSASFTVQFVGVSGFPSELNEFTTSPLVDVEDTLWALHLFPGGRDKESGFLSVGIALHSPRNLRTSYRLTIVNQMGWKNHVLTADQAKRFDARERSPAVHYENKFISRDALKNAATGHCVDDTLVLHCELIFYGDVELTVVSAPPKPLGPLDQRGASLGDELRSLLFSTDLSDVTLYVDDTAIPAHQFILCLRSPVFRTMLRQSLSMSEQLSGRVHMEDCTLGAVQALIRFLYTDHLDRTDLSEHAEELLGLSCKYDVKGLRAVCEDYLCDSLSTDNCACLLHLSDLHGARHLKQRALLFIAQNARAVTTQAQFFEPLTPSLAQEVIQALAGVWKEVRDK